MSTEDTSNTEEPGGVDEPLVPERPSPDNSAALVPSDPLQLYINKIRDYPTLTREEEHELAILYQETGDKEAAFRLVTSNMMLVVKIAFEFRSQFQSMLDLIQEGNYGLMRAVKKFDPFKGVRLSTYSAYWVRAYILKYLLDNWRMVKVGTTNTRRKLLYNLREVEEKLSVGGEPPPVKMLAEYFDASEEDVIEVQKSIGAIDTSLHQPVEEGSKTQFIDLLPARPHDYSEDMGDEQVMERFHRAVENFKTGLKPSDLTLLEKRILSEDPLTLQVIGDMHSVTREAVRQAEERLLKKLKQYLSDELSDFVEIKSTNDD